MTTFENILAAKTNTVVDLGDGTAHRLEFVFVGGVARIYFCDEVITHAKADEYIKADEESKA